MRNERDFKDFRVVMTIYQSSINWIYSLFDRGIRPSRFSGEHPSFTMSLRQRKGFTLFRQESDTEDSSTSGVSTPTHIQDEVERKVNERANERANKKIKEVSEIRYCSWEVVESPVKSERWVRDADLCMFWINEDCTRCS